MYVEVETQRGRWSTGATSTVKESVKNGIPELQFP